MTTEAIPPHVDLPADQLDVRAAAFWAVFDGQPAGVAQLVTRSGLDRPRLEAALAALDARGAITRDSAGEVTGSHGLSRVPSAYSLTLAGRQRWVWCAEDAIGIPAALALDAEVAGACAACGRPIGVSIEAGAPVSGLDTCVWLSAPVPGGRTVETR